MSAKHFLILAFVVLVKAQENNRICPCDTEQDIKDNSLLWEFLKQLSVDVDGEEMKRLYAVSPGNLYQFDCSHCDEKLRMKRKIEEPDVPEEATVNTEEVAKEAVGKDPEYAGEEIDNREKRFIRFHDLRCPIGYARYLRRCMPISEIEDLRDMTL